MWRRVPPCNVHLLRQFLCIIFAGAGLTAANAQDGFIGRSLNSSLLSQISEKDLSAIVAVSSGGQDGCLQEFGTFAEDGLSGAKTLLDLGSITKTVTAAAVLTLVDAGQLDLSTTLEELLQDVPTDKSQITIRQLLTHRAGFPESIGDDEEKIDKEDFLSRLFRPPLLSPPGKTYRYSNVGYSLLAAVIEEISRSSYESYLVNKVLKPNNLEPIGYGLAYDESRSAISGRSWLTNFQKKPIHTASWGGLPVGWNLVGNGGAVATPEGLSRFLHTLFAGKIVDLDLLHSGFRETKDGPSPEDYGFGMVKSLDGGKTVFTHDGGNDLFSAEWRYTLEDETLFLTAGLGEDAFAAMNVLINFETGLAAICTP